MPFGIQPETVGHICSVFAKHPQIETAILYGSRAKGNYKPGSDIDLTLTGDGLNLNVLNQIDNELDDLLLPWSFDLSIHSQIESQDLLEHIDRVGVVFYRRDKTT